jgi:hypothetical protein
VTTNKNDRIHRGRYWLKTHHTSGVPTRRLSWMTSILLLSRRQNELYWDKGHWKRGCWVRVLVSHPFSVVGEYCIKLKSPKRFHRNATGTDNSESHTLACTLPTNQYLVLLSFYITFGVDVCVCCACACLCVCCEVSYRRVRSIRIYAWAPLPQ